ncbi:MAG TPA: phosphatase PAP2 family protein [Chitinophagaceae bacterium]|nr:phosphatase PAP2 family protein [Chitinophagaceae bacterium]
MRLFLSLWLLVHTVDILAQSPDIELLKSIHVERNQQWDGTARFISSTEYAIGFGLPLGVCAASWMKRDPELFKKGVNMSLALALNTASTFIFKRIVNRPRPAQTYSFISPLEYERNYSFPSGHTSNAFVTATSLSLQFKKWYVVVPAHLWAGAVAYSRLHMGVHYPSDVLAGAVLGSASALATYKVNQWIHRKYAKKYWTKWF